MLKRTKYRILIKKLKKFDIIIDQERGKGSERMLYQPKTRLNYPIKHHGDNEEYSIPFLKSIQKKFSLPNNFLD